MDQANRRMGAGAAMAGAALALVGNLLHPRAADAPDARVYEDVADSGVWFVADVIIFVALVLATVGVVVAADELGQRVRNPLARQGRVGVLVGGALALAWVAVDAFAYRQQARVFVDARAADRNGAFWAVNAIDHVAGALFAGWTIVFLGLVPLVLGISALGLASHRRWVAPTGIAGGVICTIVGVVNLGISDQSDTDVPFLIGSLLVTAWVFLSGLALVRRPPVGSEAA